MHYPMELKQFPDYNDPTSIGEQILSWDYDGFKGKFQVCNLSDCPEDAIIGRDLFDAWDFVRAVEFGIQLGYFGYQNIKVQKVSVEEEEDI